MSQIMWNTTTTFAQRINLIINGTRYIVIRYIYKKNPYLFKFYFNLTSISLEIKLNKLQEVFRLDMVSSNNTNAHVYGEDEIVSIINVFVSGSSSFLPCSVEVLRQASL